MNLKKRIKYLLQSGYSLAAIATRLSLSKRQVNNVRKQIIKDRIRWNKKKPMLLDYYPVIMHSLALGKKTMQIHDILRQKIKCSYSTTARHVAGIKKLIQIKDNLPGYEAKVFFIPAGKFSKRDYKVETWIFIMKLTYSKYSFYLEVPDKNFQSFLNCHKKAFAFFEAVPRTIKINKTNAFNMNNPFLQKKYIKLLNQYSCRLVAKSNRNCSINCPTEIRFFKEQFLFCILNRSYSHLSKNLKRWFTSDVNLAIHPFTKYIIAREFKKNERPKMIPLPAKKGLAKKK